MKEIKDNVKVAEILIPGTHDSCARYEFFTDTAITQDFNFTIREQLNAGIRYLDIRCRRMKNVFTIHHGNVYQKINFGDVLKKIRYFLNENPSEMVFIQVKEEYKPGPNAKSFNKIFNRYLSKNQDIFYTGQTIPFLGEVRGKIVLVSRFTSTENHGIQAYRWNDNTSFGLIIINPD